MKAVLVIDMPDEAKAEDYRMRYGLFTNKGEEPFPYGEIAIECKDIDLIPLPSKKYEHPYPHENNEYDYGWNDCLKEITGETE